MKKALPFLVLLMLASVAAAPMPSQIVINNATMECSVYWGGDECYGCPMPEGWEVVGMEWDVECPEGYTQIELNLTCAPFRNEFCCSEGHSGANGDCDDMIINDAELKCAFVDDINNCIFPEGWTTFDVVPGGDTPQCPMGYEWVEIECTNTVQLGGNASHLDGNTTEAEENMTQKILGDVPVKKNPDNTPYAVAILAVVAIFAAFIALRKK